MNTQTTHRIRKTNITQMTHYRRVTAGAALIAALACAGTASAQEAAAPTAPVPVSFVGPEGKRVHVVVDDTPSLACDLPCTLNLAPGTAVLTISGDVTLQKHVDVSGPRATVEVSAASSAVLKKAGIIMAFSGLALLGIEGAVQDSSLVDISVTGGVAVVGSILWLAAGSDDVSIQQGDRGGNLAARGLELPRLGVSAGRTGARATLAWSF